MCGPRCKAAIDCTGYRSEMDKTVDLIVAGAYDDEAIEAFLDLQRTQERLWLRWRDEYGLDPAQPGPCECPDRDDDDED